MAHKFDVRREHDDLLVTESHPVDAERVRELYETVPRMVREAGLSKVMLDLRGVPSKMSVTDRYYYAAAFAESFLGLRVALVMVPPLLDAERFGMTVAANRGATARDFATLDEGRAWLATDKQHESAAG